MPTGTLVARMERDLDEMNRLITDMLAFARAFKLDELADCDLNRLVGELADQAARLGPVEWTPGRRVPRASARRPSGG
jgi:signal transduction histidine kinase